MFPLTYKFIPTDPLSKPEFFVGASDLELEGNWQWIIPNSNNYFNFKAGNPDNQDPNHGGIQSADCGSITMKFDGKMRDEYCQQNKLFICEM